MITLGSTGITTPQNGFGALPIQRDDLETAAAILRRAYEGGMTFFDTARAYSDSEEKMGYALSDVRKNIFIATKTTAQNTEDMKAHIDISLNNLKTDYIDVYQFHCVSRVMKPGDGSGMYELMEDFKRQGIIKHIGITSHKIGVAEEAVESGLYETLQFPFSYLSGEREIKLVESCAEHNMGFIAMKGLAGGLITDSRLAFAFMSRFDNAVPIWGVQRMNELEEWLSYMDDAPEYDSEIEAAINADKKELDGEFCRGCGYCMPCPQGITINNCARMSLMIRRARMEDWLNDHWKAEMEKTKNCVECGLCKSKCPYELNTPELLKKNYEDYMKVINGEIKL